MDPCNSKTEEELKRLAIDIVDGKIFTSSHMRNHERDIPMVFMPIVLGALSEKTEDEMKDIGLIYEYLDKAGPHSMNGFPTFFSMRILNVADTQKVDDYMQAYHEVKGTFLNKMHNPSAP